ncbi:vanillate O-demethylase ferredoxin subunit [Pseudacidovorax intermedius]|uniref:Vanillate O-demethylase ferredoxin subunit n=1 Tax=Pseudacidovorax intermedius TaxID=433924 RepID=A0A370FGJ3_9BURK|nr:PDR/VanB family oxidoreductase [Pseudacidovorax intermedius]RDI24413.1 vanillate O-demethylase ferredoxin subunit [Pseudacidovorax intermedius]
MSDHSSLPGPAGDGPAAALTLALRLAARDDEAEGIVSLTLVDPSGAALPPFTPGSHLLVECAPGVVRAYSLCNAPAERHRYLLGVLREPASRGGSAAVHEDWVVGRTVRVSPPRNHFPLVESSGRVLLLGGGIGITPLLAMAERLHAQGRPFALHYCTRTAARTAFAERLRQAPFAASVHLHHDDGPAEAAFDAARLLGARGPHDHVYACGPAGFLAHAMETARQAGWPASQLHQEVFQASVETSPGDQPFEIVVANRDITVQVPVGETALHALARAGIDVMFSCEQGVCGACVTGVIEGEPDHRDQYLTEADRARNDCFTPCCSRSRTPRLVIEI